MLITATVLDAVFDFVYAIGTLKQNYY